MTIVLNSHGLMNYAQCPRKFILSEIYDRKTSPPMEKGILFAQFLEIYYKRKMRDKNTIVSPFWADVVCKRLGISKEEGDKFWRAMHHYTIEYKDCRWHPLAIEDGFTKVLYQDSEVKVVIEGRPDLLVYDPLVKDTVVVDHKTQSSYREIPPFNHQMMAYLFAAHKNYFCYNHIVFTKEPTFRRNFIKVTDAEIEYWRACVVSMVQDMLRSKFTPNFNCMSQYGLCDFFQVCKQPNPKYQEWLLNTQFTKRTERKKSWSS